MSFFSKILGEPKTPETKKHETKRGVENTEILATENQAAPENPETPETNNFPERAEVASRNINDLEKHGFNLDDDPDLFAQNFEKTFDMPATEFQEEYVNTGKILENNTALQSLLKTWEENQGHDDKYEQLADAKGYENKNSLLKRFRESWKNSSGYKKGMVMGLILFLKFAGPTMGANHNKPTKDEFGKDKNKTEVSHEKKISGPDTKTYKLSPNSPEAPTQIENLAKLDITGSFKVDKADIAGADKAQIESAINHFLGEINSKNITKILNSEAQINISCDERPTASWKNGNEGLAQARAAAFKTIWTETIKNYKFDLEKTGLTADQVTAYKAKELKENIPTNGVTPITMLKNPATGLNWTAAEFNKLTPAEKENVYKECRYAKIDFMAYSEAEKIAQKLTVNGALIFVDESPSMKNKMGAVANAMRSIESNNKLVDTKLVFFSDKAHDMVKVDSLEGMAKAIETHQDKGNSSEKLIGSIIQTLEKMPNAADSTIKPSIAFTDEAIQDITMENLVKLQTLEKTKGISIEFYFPVAQKNNQVQCFKMSSAELAHDFLNLMNKKVKVLNEQIENLKNKVKTSGHQTRADKDLEKILEKKLADLQNGALEVSQAKMKQAKVDYSGEEVMINLPDIK